MVAFDYFINWEEAKPLSSITESKTMDFVWKAIICRFGISHVIVLDNDKQFDNTKFQTICKNLVINHRFSSAVYLIANGQVEAVNTIIKHCLKVKLEGRKGA